MDDDHPRDENLPRPNQSPVRGGRAAYRPRLARAARPNDEAPRAEPLVFKQKPPVYRNLHPDRVPRQYVLGLRC